MHHIEHGDAAAEPSQPGRRQGTPEAREVAQAQGAPEVHAVQHSYRRPESRESRECQRTAIPAEPTRVRSWTTATLRSETPRQSVRKCLIHLSAHPQCLCDTSLSFPILLKSSSSSMHFFKATSAVNYTSRDRHVPLLDSKLSLRTSASSSCCRVGHSPEPGQGHLEKKQLDQLPIRSRLSQVLYETLVLSVSNAVFVP